VLLRGLVAVLLGAIAFLIVPLAGAAAENQESAASLRLSRAKVSCERYE
jgi:hypothetical protein